jgi:hypothetical protein
MGLVRKSFKFQFLVIGKTWVVIVLPLTGFSSQDLRSDAPFKEVGIDHPKF